MNSKKGKKPVGTAKKPKPEALTIMVMNCCTALIDKYTKPVRFGVVKSDKKEAAAK